MKMAKNWNTILRWVHLIFGFCFSIYFGAITFTGNIDYWDGQPWVTMIMGTFVLGIVFWTGIISGNCLVSRSGIVTERNQKLRQIDSTSRAM